MCFPDTIPVTHESADPSATGALWSGPCQSSSGNIGIGFLAGTLLGIWGHTRGKDFSLWIVHLPVSPLSTLWAGPCQWVWVRARFCPMFWVSALEASLGDCLLGPLGRSFGPVWGIWFWRIEASIWHFVWVFLSLNCLTSSSLSLKTLKAVLTKVCWGIWGPSSSFCSFFQIYRAEWLMKWRCLGGWV
jgi:hypothetical protein